MNVAENDKRALLVIVERLCKLIERALDDGRIKAEALAIKSLVSDSTIGRIRNRQVADIGLTTYVALLRSVDDATATLMQDLVHPGFVHIRRSLSDDDLDVNGDGKVDMDDLLDIAAEVAQNSGEFQFGIREATRDKTLTPGEAMKLHELVQAVRSKPRLLAAIAAKITRGQVRGRQKCRTLAQIGGGA